MKTVAEVYRETYRTLLRFSNVAQVEQLASVCQRLASCTKSEHHTILVQEFQRVCMARGLSTELYVPIITATLKQMAVGFQFVGHGVDDLSSGSQPFLMSFAGSSNHIQALDAASLADYHSILREKEKIRFPRDIMEVCITLVGLCAVLRQALFQGTREDNPLVSAVWQLYAALTNAGSFITECFQQIAGSPAVKKYYHACIVRIIQVSVHEYMHGVSVNVAESHAGMEPLEFRTPVQELKRGTFQFSSNWVPIPEEYLEPVCGASVGGHGGSGAPSVVPASRASSVSSGRTGILSFTTDASCAPVAHVDNTAPDAEFSSTTVRPGGTRPILREHLLPSNDAGNKFCVSWWLRSSCYLPNCRRRATHFPFIRLH